MPIIQLNNYDSFHRFLDQLKQSKTTFTIEEVEQEKLIDITFVINGNTFRMTSKTETWPTETEHNDAYGHMLSMIMLKGIERRSPVDEILKNRDRLNTLLGDYTEYLEEQGYIDNDWRAELPSPIDEFLKDRGVPKI